MAAQTVKTYAARAKNITNNVKKPTNLKAIIAGGSLAGLAYGYYRTRNKVACQSAVNLNLENENAILVQAIAEYRKKHPLKENETEVFMRQTDAISLSPESVQEKHIFTTGLSGSTATALAVKCKDSFEQVALSHYTPTLRYEHLEEFEKKQKEFCNECSKRGGVSTVRAIIASPGEWDCTGPKCELKLGELVQDAAGNGTKVVPSSNEQLFFKSIEEHVAKIAKDEAAESEVVYNPHSQQELIILDDELELRKDFRIMLRPGGRSQWYCRGDGYVYHDLFPESPK